MEIPFKKTFRQLPSMALDLKHLPYTALYVGILYGFGVAEVHLPIALQAGVEGQLRLTLHFNSSYCLENSGDCRASVAKSTSSL